MQNYYAVVVYLRWLSARDDDGQIVRDLPLSNQLQGWLIFHASFLSDGNFGIL